MEKYIGAILEKVEIMCIALTIFIATAIIIFTGDEFLTTLMLLDVKQEYGKFIGGGFILSSAYLLTSILYKIYAYYRKNKNRSNYNLIIQSNIDNLTDKDLEVLQEFFDFTTGTFKEVAELDRTNPQVLLLESRGLLIRLNNQAFVVAAGSRMVAMFPYRLHSKLKWHFENERSKL